MRILVVKKSTLIRTAVFILLIVAVVIYTQVIAADGAPVFRETSRQVPVCSVETEDKKAAVTIDTAFGDDYTDEILKALDEKGVKATFFIMGLWAEKNPAKMDAIARAGHEMASHSYAHTRYTDMTPPEIKEDAAQAQQIVKKYSNKDTDIIRPPYGSVDDDSMTALKEEGYIVVKWSVDSKDWKQPGKEAIVSNVADAIRPGSIAIYQNNAMDTPLALGETIDKLLAKGYRLVTLSELLLKGETFVDETGVQRPFSD